MNRNMLRILALILATTIISSALAACRDEQGEVPLQDGAEEDQSRDENNEQDDPEEDVSPPLITNFIGIDGCFLGEYSNGVWYSTQEYPLDLELLETREFTKAEIIEKGIYYAFSDRGVTGRVTDFYDRGSPTNYDEYLDTFRFELPEGSVLAMTSGHNALPRLAEDDDPPSGAVATLGVLLAGAGLTGASVNITRCVRIDLEGDGTEEYIILANSARKDDGAEYFDQFADFDLTVDDEGRVAIPEGQGVYSFAGVYREGELETLFFAHTRQGRSYDFIDVMYDVRNLHLFDLNGDGKLEPAFTVIYWDIPEIYVYEARAKEMMMILYGVFVW